MSESVDRGAPGGSGYRRVRLILAGVAMVSGLVVCLGMRRADPDRFRQDVREALSAGRLDEADEALCRLERATRLTPEDHLMAARVATERLEYDRALEHLAEVRSPQGLRSVALGMAAEIALDRDRLAIAERKLVEAIASDPGRVEIRRLLIRIYEKQGRDDLLPHHYRELSRADELSARELLSWTRARLGLPVGDEGRRLDDLADAMLADRRDLWSALGLADLLRRAGRLADARTVLADLVDVVPSVWVARARLALEEGRFEEAERFVSSVPEVHPEVAQLVAEMRLSRGDAEGVLAALEIVESALPGRLDVARMRAQALSLLDRTSEAEAARFEWEKLASLADRVENLLRGDEMASPALVRQLARRCLEIPDLVLAREWYRLAATESPTDVEVQQTLSRLDLELSDEFALSTELSTSSDRAIRLVRENANRGRSG